jgi:exonuclease SbcC
MGVFRADAWFPIEQLGDARVVAVTGENGVGKSTALELILGALYLMTPSRGALSSLANRRDSFVETRLTAGDEELIARVMVNANTKARTTEAYLIDAATHDPINDGKVRSFKAAIGERLPSSATYLASAFAAQGGGGRFLDLPPARRKQLFAQLLGLDHLERLSSLAGDRAKAVDRELASLDGRRGALEEDAAKLDAARDAEIAAARKLDAAKDARDLAETRAHDARAAGEAWRERAAELADSSRRHQAEHDDAVKARNETTEALRAADHARAAHAAAETEAKISSEALAAAESEEAAARESHAAWRVEREGLHGASVQAEHEHARARLREQSLTDDLTRQRAKIEELRERHRELQGATATRGELERLVVLGEQGTERAGELVAELEEADAAQAAHNRARAEWSELVATAHQQLELGRAKWRPKVSAAAQAVDDAQEALDGAYARSELLRDVPCSGAGDYAGCPLIEDASKAAASIKALEAAVEAANDAYELIDADAKDAFASLQEAIAEAARAEPEELTETPDVSAIQDTITDARLAESEGVAAAARLEAVEKAETKAKTVAAEIEREQVATVACTDACDTAATEVEAAAVLAKSAATKLQACDAAEPSVPAPDGLKRLRERAARWSREEASCRTTLDAAVAAAEGRDLAAAERLVSETDAAHWAARTALSDHEAVKPEPPDTELLTELGEAVVKASELRAAAAADHDRASDAGKRLAAVKQEISEQTAELDDWRHLQRAFGRDGIQALEIDAAGPEVSALTNELLHACYGPRFTVSLETTALRADGKGTKEVFDLVVIDVERGTDGSADQLSGGERVLVSEALALAICIYNARRSGIPMLDLFRDECAGALSHTNAQRYIEMLCRALDLGGFHRVYFVAHQPHLWALADVQVEVLGNGQIQVAA